MYKCILSFFESRTVFNGLYMCYNSARKNFISFNSIFILEMYAIDKFILFIFLIVIINVK